MHIESIHYVVKVYSGTEYSVTAHAELSNGDSIASAETLYTDSDAMAAAQAQEVMLGEEDSLDVIDLRWEVQ